MYLFVDKIKNLSNGKEFFCFSDYLLSIKEIDNQLRYARESDRIDFKYKGCDYKIVKTYDIYCKNRFMKLVYWLLWLVVCDRYIR